MTLTKSPPAIRFVRHNGSDVYADSLTSFTTLRLNEEDSRMCTLDSQEKARSFAFLKDTDSAAFVEILATSGFITADPLNPCLFHVCVYEGLSGIIGYMKDMYSGTKKDGTARADDSMCLLSAEVPCTEIPFTKVEALENRGRPLVFWKFNVSFDAFPFIFDQSLGDVDGDVQEYLRIKEQWLLVSVEQWEHDSEMREFVRVTETWIDQANYLADKTSFFNVCMSLFALYQGKIVIKKRQLLVIVRACFWAFIYGMCDEGYVTTTGAVIAPEEAENMVFCRAKKLVGLFSVCRRIPLKESLLIRRRLSQISPATLEMLNDRAITSFDFAFREAELLFTGSGREVHEVLVLTAAAIVSGDIARFQRDGIVASLVLTQKSLRDVPMNDFSKRYKDALRRIDPRVLLYNIDLVTSDASC